jgi:hypothetical protein
VPVPETPDTPNRLRLSVAVLPSRSYVWPMVEAVLVFRLSWLGRLAASYVNVPVADPAPGR